MARCPDCNEFVSYGEDSEPEIRACKIVIKSSKLKEDPTITEVYATLTGEVKIILDCAECSTKLKEANIQFEIPFVHPCPRDKGGITLKVENSKAELTFRRHTLNKKGRPIRDPRYWKTFHGAHLNFQIKCEGCNSVIDLETTVEEQASHFKEL